MRETRELVMWITACTVLSRENYYHKILIQENVLLVCKRAGLPVQLKWNNQMVGDDVREVMCDRSIMFLSHMGLSPGLAHSMAVAFSQGKSPRESQRGHTRQNLSSFHNLILKVLSSHICHILCIERSQ